MFTTYKKNILIAFSMIVIEKVAWIIEPTVFGNVIDAMIDAVATPPKGSPTIPILVWIGIFCVNSGVGTYRRSRAENIFLAIYNDIVINIARKIKKDRNTSRAAARAELSREVITTTKFGFLIWLNKRSISAGRS